MWILGNGTYAAHSDDVTVVFVMATYILARAYPVASLVKHAVAATFRQFPSLHRPIGPNTQDFDATLDGTTCIRLVCQDFESLESFELGRNYLPESFESVRCSAAGPAAVAAVPGQWVHDSVA